VHLVRVDPDQRSKTRSDAAYAKIAKEDSVPISGEDFRLQHSGEIREALIMIEGDDGAFELLACGWLAGEGGGSTRPFALVRSIRADRVHLLVRSGERDARHVYNWHRIDAAALGELQNRIVHLRADTIASAAKSPSP
jgi:hypothetical protein